VTPHEPFLFFRLIWTPHHAWFPLRIAGANMKELRIEPETAHPFGRKGLAIAAAWKQMATEETAGVLFLDGDVAIDPWDYTVMLNAIATAPKHVHIAPVKLWPVSLGGDSWTWSHCKDGMFSQVLEMEPDFFSFNFTYVPRAAIEKAIQRGLATKQYPEVDRHVSRAARELGVPMNVHPLCQPKHLHY
jgi:hypothetical protein